MTRPRPDRAGPPPAARRLLLASCAAAAAVAAHAGPAAGSGPGDGRHVSMNDFGGVGLLQTRTARFGPDGMLAVGGSFVGAYARYYVAVQALPWLEGAFRFTDVRDRPSPGGGGSFRDKGADVKVRLARERRLVPQVAVGLQDGLGTGRFQGEYLVASKRFFDLDLSFGLAWGYPAHGGRWRNPLAAVSSGFAERRENRPGGGGPAFGAYFSGRRVAPFLGLEYRTPVDGLVLKLEVEGNDYGREPLGNAFGSSSPVNFGVTYRPFPWLDVSLAVERGNALMSHLSLRRALHDPGPPKFDPPPAPVRTRPRGAARARPAEPARGGREKAAAALFAELAREGIPAETLRISGPSAVVRAGPGPFREAARNVGRTARAAANVLPGAVEELTVASLWQGVETSRVTVWRRDLEDAAAGLGSPEELWAGAEVRPGRPGRPRDAVVDPGRYPRLTWGVRPDLHARVGDAGRFVRHRIDARADAELDVLPGLAVAAAYGHALHNRFEGTRRESGGVPPRVGSDAGAYLRRGGSGVERLQADYVFSPYREVYARLSAGLFERMFGGVGGEVLYRPFASRLALGAEWNWVRQRAFDAGLGFRGYDTGTGHLSVYYRWPWHDVLSVVSVGRYLARDKGATFGVSREFAGGVRAGAWFTLTDMSREEFGEGGFDKGFFLDLPLDLFLVRSTPGSGRVSYRPSLGDGGRTVRIATRLYPRTRAADLDAIARHWHRVMD